MVMFRAITKRKMPGLPNDSAILKFQKKAINDRKCSLVFAVMATVCATCWLPYFTVMLIIHVRSYLILDNLPSLDKAIEVFAIVRFMTSVINPLLYTFFKRDFWFALKTLFITRKITNPAIYRTKRMRSRSLWDTDWNTRQIFVDGSVTLGTYRKVNEGYTVSEDQIIFTTSM